MLTAKEKRQTFISNALVLYLRDQSDFFDEIQKKLTKLLEGKDKLKRFNIVTKWTRECERQAAPRIKELIIQNFL